MIKNKVQNIKIIFKTYLKILKTFANRLLFYKTSYNNFKILFSKQYFLKLFFKTVIKYDLRNT